MYNYWSIKLFSDILCDGPTTNKFQIVVSKNPSVKVLSVIEERENIRNGEIFIGYIITINQFVMMTTEVL